MNVFGYFWYPLYDDSLLHLRSEFRVLGVESNKRAISVAHTEFRYTFGDVIMIQFNGNQLELVAYSLGWDITMKIALE